ncbi:MAG: hypothetical protein LC115_00645 [Bacteroidia bacterium]|nr:hypothetical protein [Bacteroidia bacterium]
MKSFEIELRLLSVDCIRATEDEDEFYITVESVYEDKTKDELHRIPKESKGYWSISSGQSIGPNAILYSANINTGVTITVSFREEDAGGFIKIADDVLGGFSLKVLPDKTIEWKTTKTTNWTGRMDDNSQLMELTGANSLYKVRVILFEKVPL